MKKIFALIAIACVIGSAQAQRIQFQQGDKKNKNVYIKPQLVHIAESPQEGKLLVVEPVFNPSKKIKAIKVRLCDMEWKDDKDVRIDDTKNYNIETSFRTGGRLHLLLSCHDNDFVKLRHVEIDANSLDIATDNALINKQLAANEKGIVKTADSPDGKLHGAVLVTWNEITGQAKATATLYDENMRMQWQRELKWGDINQMIVTNRGEVVTAAIGYSPNNEQVSVLRFNVADANGSQAGQLLDKPTLGNLALLNYADGKIVATALEGEGARRFTIFGVREGDKAYTGLYAFCYDINSNQLAASSSHTFTNDDIRVFENASAGEQVGASTNYLNVVDYCATPQGGAVLVNRIWKYEVRGQSDNDRAFSMGMLLFQLDLDGKISSVAPIRQCNISTDWPPVAADMFLHNDKLYIVTNESGNEQEQYAPNMPAQAPTTMFKPNRALAAYAVTASGQVQKQSVVKNESALLGSPLFKVQGNKFYFLSGTSLCPTKISYITIQ